MATFTLFHEALLNIGTGVIKLNTDTFKAYLSTVTPLPATHLIKTDISEIAATGGYVSKNLTTVTYTETAGGSGVWRFNCDDISWTAVGASIPTHQFLIVYSDTSPSDSLLGFVNRGTSDVIADGNTRTWDVGASGLFEVSTTP